MSIIPPPPTNASVTDYSSNSKYNQLHSRARSMTVGSAKSEEGRVGQHVYASSSHAVLHSSSNPLLRPSILLPDTVIYYSAVAIDLLLRFTWSLKLSTHLHAIHEIEQGVFLLEALEVVRRCVLSCRGNLRSLHCGRWMWTFIRIEWEAVRKGIHHDKQSLEAIPLLEQVPQ
jgi:hypothetical protein